MTDFLQFGGAFGGSIQHAETGVLRDFLIASPKTTGHALTRRTAGNRKTWAPNTFRRLPVVLQV